MVPASSVKVPRVSTYSGFRCAIFVFAYGAFTLSGRLSQNLSANFFESLYAVRTPARSRAGLGSSGFARRYSRNHCCFLFLRLLRCFSSPGSLPQLMDWATGGGGSLRRVSPFRHPRIVGYLLLPAAFRSLSRLSSALSAKASTICSFLHDQLAFGHGIWPSGYTCLAWHASVLVFSWLMFFTSYLGCLLL